MKREKNYQTQNKHNTALLVPFQNISIQKKDTVPILILPTGTYQGTQI